MRLGDLSPLANHLWQSTMFVAIAGLLALLLRRNRAHLRHWLWLTASMKFLVPFAALIAIGHQFGWQSSAAMVQPELTLAINIISQPFAQPEVAAVSQAAARLSLLPFLVLAIWFSGCAMHLRGWWTRWQRVALVVQRATPLDDGREWETLRRLESTVGTRGGPMAVVAADTSLEPGVFGIFRSVLVWPRGIGEHLTDRQLEAILAHELCHVRRRDNLAAAIHMLVETLFWFHPLVWWLERRLVDERERACDEAVLRMGHQPQVYAESILRTCEFSVESPLVCIAGVTGSTLKKRVEAIMRNEPAVVPSTLQKLLLWTAGAAAIGIPLAVGVLQAPPLVARAQATADPTGASFEVASVKANKSGENGLLMQASPGGRISVTNASLRLLIRNAYRVLDLQIVGGPDWITSDRFDIDARSSGNPTQPQIQMMLRRLLADRFRLTMHTETRELPVYALMLARSDRRLGPRLRTAEPCFRSPVDGPPLQPPLLGPGPCGFTVGVGRGTARGVTMGAFAASLSNQVGRVVQDRTGLVGNFDLELEFTPQQALIGPGGAPDTLSSPPGNRPSIFTALQEQLGLKLESQRGPVEVLVVNRAERPGPE